MGYGTKLRQAKARGGGEACIFDLTIEKNRKQIYQTKFANFNYSLRKGGCGVVLGTLAKRQELRYYFG